MFLQCQPGRQCSQQPLEDHRVGCSCSKPDRFFWVRVRVGVLVGYYEGKGGWRVRIAGWGVG